MNKPLLDLAHLSRWFPQGEGQLHILTDVNLQVHAGECVALVGPSGSGKSTLLQLAGLLEAPSGGSICIQGQACESLDESARTALRLSTIGFVYQFHHLLPEFTALENVMLPQLIAGVAESVAVRRATELLTSLGMAERLTHRPAKLSGGEQQRVAILRAIANGPALLLADEPTGNLDEATAEVVFHELMTLVKKARMGALIATHNPDLAKRMDRVVHLQNGQLK